MRLLSYNIHKGVGGRDRRYDLARVIEVIQHEEPDLICLQEVVASARRCRFQNQPRMLAEHFQAQGVLFQPNVHYRQGNYGNLILSRWPIGTHHHVSLRLQQKRPRGAQLAIVHTPEGLLHLVNFHLGLAERERHWQVNHLLSHRLYRESAHLPTLLTGDYNDWRNTLASAAFNSHGAQQITHPMSRFRSFPAWMPVGSLDKAFYRGAIEIEHARIVRTRQARLASDHLPLVIDFRLADEASLANGMQD